MRKSEKLNQLFKQYGNEPSFRDCLGELYVLDTSGREKIERTLNLAVENFAGKKRISGEPYVNHLICVALLLLFAGERDPDAICAALLHDLLEDLREDWNYTRLMESTSHRVALLVVT